MCLDRSLRFFKLIRDIQRGESPSVSCPACDRTDIPIPDIAVLSTCGHSGCFECLKSAAMNQNCVVSGCETAARVLNVVKATSLGREDVAEGQGRHFGAKLEKVVELIWGRIPVDEKVWIDCYFCWVVGIVY